MTGKQQPGIDWGIAGSTLMIRPVPATGLQSAWSSFANLEICATSRAGDEPYVPNATTISDAIPLNAVESCF